VIAVSATPSVSALAARTRDYSSRIGDRLDRAGLPLRRRALLFFARPLAAIPRLAKPPFGMDLEVVSVARFLSLQWRAYAGVRAEAADYRGGGRQWPIAAVRAEEMLGFCWLESGTADLRFFEVEAPIPAAMAYLSHVWVAPSSRGCGVGRALIERAASEAATTLGCHDIVSACVPANERMKHLFLELGWSTFGRVDYLRAGPAMLFNLRRAGKRARRVWSSAEASRLIFAR
jgi:GNAT superfamily N-acetyltransferase